MSRSYKKNPFYVDGTNHKSNKQDKALANRRYRRRTKLGEYEPTSKRAFHKRANESYDIADYSFYYPLERWKERYDYDKLDERQKKECIRRWRRWYKNK